MSGADDTGDLVRRLRAGDETAAEALDRAHRPALVRFCAGYLGSVDEAEDAAQEVLAKLWRADAVPERFRAWVYTVARNHCLNLRRGRARRRDAEPLRSDVELFRTVSGAATRLVRREEAARIAALVASLGEAEREVVRMRYGEELSRDEIAEVLGVPTSVVKSRLYEAMKKLRARAGDG